MSLLICIISIFICYFIRSYLKWDEVPNIETLGPYLVLILIGQGLSKIILMNFDIVSTTLLHCNASDSNIDKNLDDEDNFY
jgi:hypothetical protein